MDLNQFKLFKALGARMDWLQSRQRVLAENVANADTPGYKSKDIRPLSFKSNLAGTSSKHNLTTTDAAHFRSSGGDANVRIVTSMTGSEGSATGNNIVLEEEVMKSARTATDYQLATNLYKKSVGLLRLAISKS